MKSLQNKKWLVGVSGGCDSMALLNMCIEEELEIVVAHINYKVRKEADLEEEHVHSFCAQHGITLVVKNEPFTWNGNFEACARDYRYNFFKELITEYQLDGVLIAHQQDDVLETYYMQKNKNIIPNTYGLQRESYLKGILVIRPLLDYSRKQLEEYCKEKNISYDTDSSNLSDDYERNQIRHHIISQYTEKERQETLKEIEDNNHPLSSISTEANQLLDDQTITLDLYKSKDDEVRLTALRKLIEDKLDQQPSLEYLKEIDHIIMTKKDYLISLPHFDLTKQDDCLFSCKKSVSYAYQYSDVVFEKKDYFQTKKSGPSTCAVTINEEDYPITIRSVQDGDEIQMCFGKKRIHRFFIDRHIPLYQRKKWPVVLNKNGEIILVPGLGCNISHYSTNPNLYVIQCLTMEDCLYVGREGYKKDSCQ